MISILGTFGTFVFDAIPSIEGTFAVEIPNHPRESGIPFQDCQIETPNEWRIEGVIASDGEQDARARERLLRDIQRRADRVTLALPDETVENLVIQSITGRRTTEYSNTISVSVTFKKITEVTTAMVYVAPAKRPSSRKDATKQDLKAASKKDEEKVTILGDAYRGATGWTLHRGAER